jgi:hypothetical protein
MMVSNVAIATYRIGASVQDHRRPDLSPSGARAPAGAVDLGLDLLEADPPGPARYHRPAADLPSAPAPADDVLLLGGHRPGGDLVALTAPNRALVSASVDARAVRSAHALVELDLLVVDLSAPRSGLLAGSAEQRAALVTGVAVLVLVAPPGPALTELARLADALTAAGAGPVELAVRRGEVTATLRPRSVGSDSGSAGPGRLDGRLASDLGRSLLGLLGQTAEHLESVTGERDAARRESWIRSGQLAGALARERQELAEQHALLDEITELRATVRLLERKLRRAADRARPAPPVPMRRRVVRRVGRRLPAPVRRVVRSVVRAIRR